MAGSGSLVNFSVIVESKMLLVLFSYFIGRRCYVKEMIHAFANFLFMSLISFLWPVAEVGPKQCGWFRFGLLVVVSFCVCEKSHRG